MELSTGSAIKCNTMHWLCSLEMGNTDYPRNYAGTLLHLLPVLCYKLDVFKKNPRKSLRREQLRGAI